MKHLVAVSLVVLLVAAGSALAERTVALNAVKDSGMYGAAAGGNSNRGDGGRWDINVTGDDGGLLQFDFSGVTLAAGESISAVTLECFSASGGPSTFDWTLVAYPLVDPWVEGDGTTGGTSGSTGYPWGPATEGDAVYNYKVVSAVAANAGFGGYDTATAGTAWNTPGGRGIGSDVLDRKMMDWAMSGSQYWSPPTSYGVMDFTAGGVAVVDEWVAGTLDNNGFSIWAADGTGEWRAASRENVTGGVAVLELTIVPEPATMGLLGLGTLGLAALRRRRRK